MHRPLSAYATALFRAGLVITDLRERGDREVPVAAGCPRRENASEFGTHGHSDAGRYLG
jgi:hypothetical protein